MLAHFNDISYQMNHFLLALSFSVLWVLRWHHSLLVAGISVTAFATFKEFWWDLKFEGASVVGSGLLDFSFYELGLLVAVLLLK